MVIARTDDPRIHLAVTITETEAGDLNVTIAAGASVRPHWDAEGADPVEDLGDLIADVLKEGQRVASAELARRLQ
jgi:hypothetical protein